MPIKVRIHNSMFGYERDDIVSICTTDEEVALEVAQNIDKHADVSVVHENRNLVEGLEIILAGKTPSDQARHLSQALLSESNEVEEYEISLAKTDAARELLKLRVGVMRHSADMLRALDQEQFRQRTASQNFLSRVIPEGTDRGKLRDIANTWNHPPSDTSEHIAMPEGEIALTLTAEEALSLRILTEHVGGDPVSSRRRDIDSIRHKLYASGVEMTSNNVDGFRGEVHAYT